MAINLAKKYSPQIDQIWTNASFFDGKVSAKYDLVGVRSLTITAPITVDLVDYTRSGLARFGTLNEMQDEIQELTMSQDKAWTMSIDAGNASDQLNVKKAGEALRQQLEEKVIPLYDKWALKQFAFKAGKSLVQAAMSSSNALEFVLAARAHFVNNAVPNGNRYLYISATKANFIRQSTLFTSVDPVAAPLVRSGVIGALYGFDIVEMPDDYFPTGIQFVAMHKEAGIAPKKIHMLRILTNQRGIDGAILEGHHYFDAFVIAKKSSGIFTSVLTANKQAIPVITPTGASHAAVSSGGTLYYTLDGSDPRYSATRVAYASAVTLTSGQTIKVCGEATDKCVSDVASAYYA